MDLKDKKIVKNYLNEQFKINRIKLILCIIFQNFFSISIMLLNIVIIGLSIWSFSILLIELCKKESSIEIINIVIPLLISIFTILIFIVSIALLVYSVKNHEMKLLKTANSYQNLIFQINNDELNFDEAEKEVNSIETYNKNTDPINYKEIIKDVLGGK